MTMKAKGRGKAKELKVEEERKAGKVGGAAVFDSENEKEKKKEFRIKYEKVKGKVKELEEKNFSRLVLFSSGSEWFKMGGNSLLIYKYVIAPI